MTRTIAVLPIIIGRGRANNDPWTTRQNKQQPLLPSIPKRPLQVLTKIFDRFDSDR